MINHTNRLIVSSVLLVVAFALTGCGKSSPPKDGVRNAVAVVLPPFLSVDSIDVEPIATGPESYKINFKAVLATKENLYLLDREAEGTPKVTLLKVIQAAGSKVSIYGFLEARRMMDKWMLDTPVIQVGLDQFGKPRGAFDAQSYVTGSDEANVALNQQRVNAELQAQAKKAALDQQEREKLEQEKREEERRKLQEERQAREDKARKEREAQAKIEAEEQRQKEEEQRKKEEEQRKVEEEAAHQKLILATVPGASYIGTISWKDEIQHLRLVFTEQKGFMISAKANNPDSPNAAQAFKGELVFNAEPEKDGSVYSIFMSPIGGLEDNFENNKKYWHLYVRGKGSLKLRLTETGLDGIANISNTYYIDARYTIRLQREGRPRATSPSPAAPNPGNVVPAPVAPSPSVPVLPSPPVRMSPDADRSRP